ncbi:MAG: TetR/AcrR family transcriptional regulator [Lactobacillales bacterium]|jgi:AcrR family transcriptional regulator|nr:TetR/AcrR family transcriptional regulator [Lactobacillales bacterium]
MKRKLTYDEIIQTATELVEEKGMENLSVHEISSRLGVKTPSLYNHVKGMDDIRSGVKKFVLKFVAQGMNEAAAGKDSYEAVCDIAIKYRLLAKEHLMLFKVMNGDPKHENIEHLAVLFKQILEPLNLKNEDEVTFIRLYYASIKGFCELDGHYHIDEVSPDYSYDELIKTMIQLLGNYAKRGKKQ